MKSIWSKSHNILWLLVFITGGVAQSIAQSQFFVQDLHNTGVISNDPNGSNAQLAAPGTPDPSWTLISAPPGGGSTAMIATDIPGNYLPNSASLDSQWIGPAASQFLRELASASGSSARSMGRTLTPSAVNS